MFERFSADARHVVVEAQGHARRLGHAYIGCEHLLLALASAPDDVGTTMRSSGITPEAVQDAVRRLVGSAGDGFDRDALAGIGIDLDAVRDKAEAAFGPGALADRPPPRRRWRRRNCRDGDARGHIPFTPRAKKCLQLSLREALALHDGHIGSEHIALALTRLDDAASARVLRTLGVSPEQLRAEIRNRHRLAG